MTTLKDRIVPLVALIAMALSIQSCIELELESSEVEKEEMQSADRILTSGQIWSSAPGIPGLGGVGRQVALGELSLADPTAQQAVLTLGLTNLDPAVALNSGRIYAKVIYGIGAANQTVILDWSQTTSIALPVGKINITAVQVDSKGAPLLWMPGGYTTNFGENIPARITLTASLSSGARSSLFAPTLTQSINLAAGVTVPWQVPARAKRVLVGDTNGFLGSDIQVDVVGSLSINTYQLSNLADSEIRTNGVSLPGLTDHVQLTSPGGASFVPLCWFLDG